MKPIRLAIFASGSGSNAQRLMAYFANHNRISIALVVCNKAGAGVFDHAKKAQIPAVLLQNRSDYESNVVGELLREKSIDFIVLAGFLLKIPDSLIEQFPEKMVNIHPSLLPKFGGKGMYGIHVHRAVLEAGETRSGITIHLVNGHYDEGRVIDQVSCPVLPNDSPETLALRVQQLEHLHFAPAIENYLLHGR